MLHILLFKWGFFLFLVIFFLNYKNNNWQTPSEDYCYIL